MGILSLWPILLLWLIRTFSILLIRDWYYGTRYKTRYGVELYDGEWHYIIKSEDAKYWHDGDIVIKNLLQRKSGMNTPKGLLICNENKQGSETTTITPPISNLRIAKRKLRVLNIGKLRSDHFGTV